MFTIDKDENDGYSYIWQAMERIGDDDDDDDDVNNRRIELVMMMIMLTVDEVHDVKNRLWWEWELGIPMPRKRKFALFSNEYCCVVMTCKVFEEYCYKSSHYLQGV